MLGGGTIAYSQESGAPDPGRNQWQEWLKDLEKEADDYLKHPPTGCSERERCRCVKYPPGQDPKWSDPTSILFQQDYEMSGHTYGVGRTYNVKFRDFSGKCAPEVVGFPKKTVQPKKEEQKKNKK